MSKRGAQTDLNQDNWDQESDKEDAGVFTPATSEEMKTRKVKVAKRRCPQTDAQPGGGMFSNLNFSGQNSNAPNFNFIQPPKTTSLTETIGGTVNGKTSSILSSLATQAQEKPAAGRDVVNDLSQSPNAFLHGLKSLNEAVVKWITMHVQQTPHCLLSPIFKDYDKYVSDLESKYPDGMVVFTHSPKRSRSNTNLLQSDPEEPVEMFKSSVPSSSSLEKTPSSFVNNVIPFSQSIASASSKSSSSATNINFFSNAKESDKGMEIKEAASFIHGGDEDKELPVPTASVSPKFFSKESLSSGATSTPSIFGGLQPKAVASKFSFGSGNRPFSFAVAASESENKSTTDDNETGETEEYIPPKVEVIPVVEEDSIYTIKCKLFFSKNNEYKEKGVGMLHIKKLDDDKSQLLIRADTNLGNILLNIVLNESVVTKRTGKNNVILLCVPNPPLEPTKENEQISNTPVPLLIRVKTSDNADELFENINKYKS